jgi:hypothetical protein
MLDHVNWIDDHVMEASATFRASRIDPQTAVSSAAVNLKFLPTLAKLEQRDLAGVDMLQQLWFDWSAFHTAYEGDDIEGLELDVRLGEKLPLNRVDKLNELNNMMDRKVISRRYYRSQMVTMGYTFPDDIDQQIDAERKADIEMQRLTALATAGPEPLSSGGQPENKSNNKNKPNESGGTESTRNTAIQANAGGK